MDHRRLLDRGIVSGLRPSPAIEPPELERDAAPRPMTLRCKVEAATLADGGSQAGPFNKYFNYSAIVTLDVRFGSQADIIKSA